MTKGIMQSKWGIIAVIATAGTCWTAAAQHGHLNAGALGQNQGDKLNFANGSIFAVESGYVKSLTAQTSGTYAGYYQGGITLTSLATTVDNGGPVAGAAAPGAFLNARITSVQGPAGGYFSFWEEGATVPTVSLASGTVNSTTSFALSDADLGAGAAGADPYGHLHGRTFTASLAGEYTVGFTLFDSSKNGTGGGAIHADGDTLFIKFNAVPEPGTVAMMGLGGVALVWAIARRRAA